MNQDNSIIAALENIAKPKEQEKKLSDEQKEIVDHFVKEGGPLLVNAGPGSGKTMVAAHMVFRLIKEKGVSPEDILLISHTKAAVIELKKHIKIKWGDDGMPDITITNFHELAKKFLKEIFDSRNNYACLELMDDRMAKIFIKRFAFSSKNKLKNDLLNMSKKSHNDDWFTSILVVCCQKFLKKFIPEKNQETNNFFEQQFDIEMEEREVIYNSELNHLEVKQELDNLHNLFGDFESRREGEKEYWRYDEWLALCLQEWEKNPPTKNYKYVIVDEFQDTSVLEYSFLEKICSENENSGSKNLCCIGDLDQAIFAFMGACPNIFEKFYSDNKKIIIKNIETNRRSSKKIVQISQDLIKNIKKSENFSKSLKPIKQDDYGSILWIKNSNPEIIFQKIKKIFFKEKDGESQKEFLLGEIAVISLSWATTKEKDFLNKFTSKLNAWAKKDSIFKIGQKIFQHFQKTEQYIFDNNENWIILLLQICDWKDDDDYDDLHYWINEIIHLKKIDDVKKNKYFDALKTYKFLEKKTNFFEWYINKYPQEDLIHKLNAFREENKKLCKQFFDTSKFENLISKESDIEEKIKKFEKKIHEYQFLNSSIKLSEHSVKLMAKNIKKERNKHKRFHQVLSVIWCLKTQETELTDNRCIQIMSAHGSKGKEFKYVFIVNLDETRLFKTKYEKRAKYLLIDFSTEEQESMKKERDLTTIYNSIKCLEYQMMDTKTDESTRKKLKAQKDFWELHRYTLEEEIKALYVGITRAKEYLYICSPPNVPSSLIDLISDHLKDDDDDL